LYSPLSPPVSEPLTNRGVLLSTLLQDILHPSHNLLNVLLHIANKLGLSNKKKVILTFGLSLLLLHFYELNFVIYGWETRSLALKEGRRLVMFENRMLRRLFGPKWGEVIGDWRKSS
jgi:hypothetical protein